MKRLLLVTGLVLALLGPAGTVVAASDNASVVGKCSSQFGPSGLRDDIAHDVKQEAAVQGVPPGALYSPFARMHGACPEAP